VPLLANKVRAFASPRRDRIQQREQQLREVLRLTREIAGRIGMAPSTDRVTIGRFEAASLSWPLPNDITDATLKASLFPRS
jgi:hypothetical protein